MKILILVLCIIILGASGCHNPRNVERKIQSSIASTQNIFKTTKSKSAQYVSNCLLHDLRSATPETLKLPKISVSIYTRDDNNELTIVVFWLCKSPRANQLIIEDRKSGEKHLINIPKQYIVENTQDSRNGVIFRVFENISVGTSLWKALNEPNENDTEPRFYLSLDGDTKSAPAKLTLWKE